MHQFRFLFLIALLFSVACKQDESAKQFELAATHASLDDQLPFTRKELIYARTEGTALTMDVFTPNKKNIHRAIVVFISEGWYSSHEKIEYNIPIYVQPLIDAGYTVCTVIHGSNPKFSLSENVQHAKWAMRYVRSHAAELDIDPEKIGATGDSAGGHLSLMMACADKDTGDSISCKANAVVAFFPPTDFFNWGEKGKRMFGIHPKVKLLAAFRFTELNKQTNCYEPIVEPARVDSIVRSVSPFYQVSETTSPCFLVYGNKDSYIPVQQSILFAEQLKKYKVPTDVAIEEGGEHDEITIQHQFAKALEWFQKYLK